MKTYVLIVSRFFPAKHKRKGEPTGFVNKILSGEKIHTIRSNYPVWEKRIREVRDGKAVLSLRYWEGLPYRSRQTEFMSVMGVDIGIQKLTFLKDKDGSASWKYFDVDGNFSEIEKLSNNDGLLLCDFKEWFKDYDLSESLAIIHFTKFRYI